MSEPFLGANEHLYVNDCMASGWISSSGSYITRFEKDWATYCGMKHGIAVSNGTTALQVAVDALQLGPGDEVILPSFTIISCALAVVRAGATPVVVDSDPKTYCMDIDQVAAAITPRTRAIMPVHMYGHPVDMDAISAIAAQHGLAVIEDAAQAHGCEYFSRHGGNNAWRRCGGLGKLSTFSFFANKLVTTGEGGMVLTSDDALAERCRSLRNLCFQPTRFQHEELGYNYRFTNLQAAIGVAQVERMDEILSRKRMMGALYDELLAGVQELILPAQEDWARINYWMYAIQLEDHVDMDAFQFAAALKERGVETRPFFLGMHEQPVFRKQGLFKGLSLPVSERLYRRGLYLPSGVGITEAQIRTVVDAVKGVLA
ncbi:MAG TPA: DegT/DnrJ/EryC1/StrS family aminotransferase [Rhizomicrobium sp.]|nr:DegT/DnrJ/EryC1/StrS family aminotransferase [Rhizomicrobium sp.]